MADLNYEGVVPRPEIGWKPEGFLAGQLYARDRARYDDRASLSDAMAGFAGQKAQGELQDYFANAPVREATRLGDIAKAKANELTAVPQAQANLETTIQSNTKAARENKMGNQTYQSDVAAKLAENAAKQQGDASKVFKSMSEAAILASSFDSSSLSGREELLNRLKESGMDRNPEILRIASEPDRQKKQAMREHIVSILNMADSKYREEIDKQKLHNEGTIAVAKQQGSNMVAAANARGNITRTWQEAISQSKNLDQATINAKMALLEPDLDPTVREQAKAVLIHSLQEKMMRLKVKIPANLPGMPPNELIRMIDDVTAKLSQVGGSSGDPLAGPGDRGESDVPPAGAVRRIR